MRGIKLLLIFILLGGGQMLHAQLKLNDTLPMKAQYGKGSLIINFWATWCEPCAKELEVLAKMSDTHHDDLTVLCVAYEDSVTVNKYWKQHPIFARSRLVLISQDKYFGKLFFHQALPHNVWVNPKGIIVSITGGDEINELNIGKFLTNQKINLYQKTETPFEMNKPMQIPDSLLQYRSMFSKTLPGVRLSGSNISSHNWGIPNMKRFFCFNNTIRGMFYEAYQMGPLWGRQSSAYLIEVHASDSSKYFWPGRSSGISESDWGRAHTFSYELRLPQKISDSAFSKKVVSELEFNLGIKTARELRPRKCMVVSKNDSCLLQQADPKKSGTINIVGNQFLINNVPLAKVFEFITKYTFSKSSQSRIEPYVDETRITGPISLTLDLGADTALYRNQEFLEKCLTNAGLSFSMETRQYPIIVIYDN